MATGPKKYALLAFLLLVQLASPGFGFTAATYSNPVYEENFVVNFWGKTMELGIGDPTVLLHDGIYYMYATGNNHSYHVYNSKDLVHWRKGPVIFETKENGLWAPDVFYNPDDTQFYLYYTVSRRLCVAVANRPDTLFTDKGTLIRDAIDAHMFLDDDGRYFLYYASYPQLNIYVQEMASPLRKKDTPPVKLLEPAALWEEKHIQVTEAPWLLKHNGIYYLLYSGGSPDSVDYAIGYATSKSPTGPFMRYAGNPIIKKGNGVYGPGHASVTVDNKGNLWMVYHQKKNAQRNWMRFIALDRLWFDNKGNLHGMATRSTAEPAPSTSAPIKQNRQSR